MGHTERLTKNNGSSIIVPVVNNGINTMGLVHPALSTVGRRKGKKKFASAEAARQHRELQAEWQRKQSEWANMSKATTVAKSATVAAKSPVVKSNIRETQRGASLNSWVTGAVASKPAQQYTGDQVLGIAVMHKSCLQPVFNAQAAVDIAKMRRG